MRRSITTALLLSLVAVSACRQVKRVVGYGGSRAVIGYIVQLDVPTALAVTTAEVNAVVEEAIRSRGFRADELLADELDDSSPYLQLVGTVLNGDQHRIRLHWTDTTGVCSRPRDAILEVRGQLIAQVRDVVDCVQAANR